MLASCIDNHSRDLRFDSRRVAFDRFVETGYRTLPFPFDELAPPEFEMTLDWTLGELLAYLRTWSATART